MRAGGDEAAYNEMVADAAEAMNQAAMDQHGESGLDVVVLASVVIPDVVVRKVIVLGRHRTLTFSFNVF